MDIATMIRTLIPLADAFELYSIPYYLTGSLAVSVLKTFQEPMTTVYKY